MLLNTMAESLTESHLHVPCFWAYFLVVYQLLVFLCMAEIIIDRERLLCMCVSKHLLLLLCHVCTLNN